MLRPFGAQFPRVHRTAYIDPSAQIIGDVEIGEESSVWMNVVIRGDVHRIRIGKRTNVQDNSVIHVMKELHDTVLGDEVTIGHGAVLHGCRIEDCVLVGMGAIILNGARIGSGSIVAAGSLVVEGASIPSRSLIMGSPAKFRRLTTESELVEIQRYAQHYVAYRRDYQHQAAHS